ncbi:hypothetical protein EST38_g8970 [Candolleomyces aberdarensis]|uniref:Uncharacterized protein n=1 Tax=Candolleomyces aberdarensis TaxID=2316362 RepID=A0A4Q2DE20_9AGAR|nr:hypothetical protein EST38_g8970 [Candolleomyces aberdarensis]
MSEDPKSLTHLYRTNDPLNPTEITTIQAELVRQDAAILKLQQQLRNLEVGREKYASLLSPLRQKPLPIELLGDIFAIVIARLHFQLDDLELGSGHTAGRPGVRENVSRARSKLIQLCLVCRAWRDAVYATPYLWSRLDLYWPSLDFDKVVRWFALARGHPKSLYISPTYLYGFKEHQFDTLAKLLDQGPLLEHLELDMINGTSGLGEGGRLYKKMITKLKYSKVYAMKGKRPWDLLTSFSIRIDDANISSESDVVIPFRHLTTLYLTLPEFYEGIPWDDEVGDSPDLQAPLGFSPDTLLGGLTRLTIAQCDWKISALLALLRWCTKVETLTVGYADRDEYHDDEEPSSNFLSELADKGVSLPALKVLRLRNVDRNQKRAYSVLRFLSTPNLEELDMGFAKVEGAAEDGRGYEFEDPEFSFQDCVQLERVVESFGERIMKEVEVAGAKAKREAEPSKSSSGQSGETILQTGLGPFRRLRLRNLYISSKSLTTILLSVPASTSHLTLDSIYSDSTLFQQLQDPLKYVSPTAPRLLYGYLLPKLQILEILDIRRECTHIPDIYGFVASRRPLGLFNVPGMEGTERLRELKMSIIEKNKLKGKKEGGEEELGASRADDILRLVYGINVDVRVVRA